ncbi:hypothetical protein B0H16DRAFT_1713562 [Mycena metata]|uniref:Uncharacterized protein n=1 Tax=Mycena metata TaxID=1033252 RepID=A0AAD7JZH2_9AGAR|nr:hypothetical protein B0H16DRAFT_1713562 [Mycena metata]
MYSFFSASASGSASLVSFGSLFLATFVSLFLPDFLTHNEDLYAGSTPSRTSTTPAKTTLHQEDRAAIGHARLILWVDRMTVV